MLEVKGLTRKPPSPPCSAWPSSRRRGLPCHSNPPPLAPQKPSPRSRYWPPSTPAWWNSPCKPPFAATYAPSHTPAAISFVLFITAFSIYAYGYAAIAGQLILKPLPWLIAAAALSAIWLVLRRKRRSQWGHEPFTFADDGDTTVQVTNFAPE